MDIVWLQRDLGLYIVGLFDTHYAARALGYPGGSLAYLLKRFANVDAQKQYQMADWRIRPLPQELFDYARSDTHYLLYIYDCMRNDLIQRSDLAVPGGEGDKIAAVLQKSSETALQRYEYPIYDSVLGQGPVGWYKILSRTPALFTKEQFAVFRAVHSWRDEVAREQDDSVHWVMPNHQIFSLAREMPTNRAAVVAMCQPTTQTVRLRADELVDIIVNAKEGGKDGPELAEVLAKIETPHKNFKSAPASADKIEEPVHAVKYFEQNIPATAAHGIGVSPAIPLAIRSTTSTFWGNAFGSSLHDHEQQRGISTTGSRGRVELRVPLPALTAEVFADPTDLAVSSPFPATEAATSSPTPIQRNTAEAVDDDVFVIRDLKRKRQDQNENENENEETPATTAPPTQINGEPNAEEEEQTDEETTLLRAKIAEKEAKKEAKRLAKLARTAPSHAQSRQEPFDYASAPSFLNPPREELSGGRKDGKGEKGTGRMLDPYKKALDTPKGLPRAQRERAGKSGSWKS